MKWSYLFGEYFGIAVRMHVSFLVLIGWIALSTYSSTGSLAVMFSSLVMICALFTCVVMHEYGHALMARRYGIGTREITLLPIGGLAQLDRIPEEPRQELAIALAGPAVNVVLAGLALSMMWLGGNLDLIIEDGLFGGSLLAALFRVNIIMAVFNLVPALPMDGGRVLRALLAMRLPALRATRIATQVAKALAGAMMATGLLTGQMMLAVIGGFVWISAGAEYDRARQLDANRRRGRGPGIDWFGQSGSAHSPGERVNPGDPGPVRPGERFVVEVIGQEPNGRPRIRVVRREP
jgi:stage IV sporulation protein FB